MVPDLPSCAEASSSRSSRAVVLRRSRRIYRSVSFLSEGKFSAPDLRQYLNVRPVLLASFNFPERCTQRKEEVAQRGGPEEERVMNPGGENFTRRQILRGAGGLAVGALAAQLIEACGGG